MASDHDPQRAPPSRGDQLLEDIKHNRLRPGQFRISALLLALLAVAILFSIPRLAGWSYTWFLGLVWMAAFAFAPLLALVITALVPWLAYRTRMLLAATCITLIVVPTLAYVAWLGEADTIPKALTWISFWFWLPQAICIWGVWYFLFRKAPR